MMVPFFERPSSMLEGKNRPVGIKGGKMKRSESPKKNKLRKQINRTKELKQQASRYQTGVNSKYATS